MIKDFKIWRLRKTIDYLSKRLDINQRKLKYKIAALKTVRDIHYSANPDHIDEKEAMAYMPFENYLNKRMRKLQDKVRKLEASIELCRKKIEYVQS